MITTATEFDAQARARFWPLRPAEEVLLKACTGGGIAKVGLRRPSEPTGDQTVRAELLAFMLGGGPWRPTRQLELMGAWITGRLDLGEARIAGSVWFYRCVFDQAVVLDGAHVSGHLSFGGCRLKSVQADDLVVGKDLALNAGCRIEDELHLMRARIGGAVDLARLDLRGRGEAERRRRVLLADGLQTGGDLSLVDGFEAIGEVHLTGATIGGHLRVNAHLTGPELRAGQRAPALLAPRLTVRGNVDLRGLAAAGRTDLTQARVGGDLDATGASFDRLGDAAWADGPALVLDRARIGGTLALRSLQAPLIAASLAGARTRTLADDEGTWGERLVLDGFEYSRFGDGSPLDSGFRIGWLERQDPSQLRAPLQLQPWRRAIGVLRRMGHPHRAASVAVRRERWLRASGHIGAWAPPSLRWLPQAAHALWGLLAGYGQRPLRLAAWAALAWVLAGAAFWALAGAQIDQLAASFGLSLNRLLPLVDPWPVAGWQAAEGWGDAAAWLGRGQAAFGALLSLLAVATLAGWADRERR